MWGRIAALLTFDIGSTVFFWHGPGIRESGPGRLRVARKLRDLGTQGPRLFWLFGRKRCRREILFTYLRAKYEI